jgi:hypothetical protein
MTGAELAAIITAGGSALGAATATLKFIWNKIDRRIAHIEKELDHCRTREERSQKRRAVHTLVIELLWQEVKRLAPGTTPPALTRAKRLLDDIKRLDRDNIESDALDIEMETEQ